MPKIVWFNRPTNHSGYLNLLYLTPDGDIDKESAYTDLITGYFIMGGPEIIRYYDEITEAGKTLIACLDAGFYFYPESNEENIRQAIKQKKDEIDEYKDKFRVYKLFDEITVFSKEYSDFECLKMLLDEEEPESPVVFVDVEEGLDALCRDLARIYYDLPKKNQTEVRF